jgi:hypothetical protein
VETTDEFDRHYKLLRNWYLAYLRKEIQAEQAKLQMTPGSLMAADQEIVMQLAAAKVGQSRIDESPPSKLSRLICLLALWIFVCFCFAVWLYLDSGGDIVETRQDFFLLTAGIWLMSGESVHLKIMPIFLLLPVAFYGIPLGALVMHFQVKR